MVTLDENLAKNETNETSEPLMDGDLVDRETQLRGVIVQTIADLGAQHSLNDITTVVQERAQDAELGYSRAEVLAQLHSVLGGASAGPSGEGA